jgi:hypothetical protein
MIPPRAYLVILAWFAIREANARLRMVARGHAVPGPELSASIARHVRTERLLRYVQSRSVHTLPLQTARLGRIRRAKAIRYDHQAA